MLLSVYGNVDACSIVVICSGGAKSIKCSGNYKCEGDGNSVTCINTDGSGTQGTCTDSGGGRGSGSGSGSIASIDHTP